MAMIEAAEAEGRIEPGRNTIVESTSGNTGIALAFVCAAKGYDLVITMPQGMSREREKLLRLYGAEVVWVESMGGMNEAIEEAKADLPRARQLLRPEPVLEPRQRRSTGARRPRRSGATPRARSTCSWPRSARAGRSPAAASASRSATRGCTWWRSSRRRRPSSRQEAWPAQDRRDRARVHPEVLNRDVIDEIMPVEDEDAIETARLCARREGVAGISAGAAVWAAVHLGSRPEMRGKRIVAILPDSGDRYISTPFFAP